LPMSVAFKKQVLLTGVAVMMSLLFGILFASPARAGEIEYRPLRDELRNYLAQQKGVYGVYIIDLQSGKTAGINENQEFHAASTFKVPMALYVYHQVAAGKLDPERLLAIAPSHMEGGTGRLQFSPPGTKKSVDELVRYAIVYSDNVATNMLLGLVGKKAVKDYMRSLGGEVVDGQKNTTCPEDMAVYMREAVRFAGASPWGEKLLDHLRHTVYTDRIPYPLPDVPVANKIGNWPLLGAYNDVAYVEHPGRPYIISVFSRGTGSYENAVAVIRRISRTVYQYQDSPALKADLVLDGKELSLAEQAFAMGGVTLVPVRDFADAVPEIVLGWEASTGAITINSTLGGTEKHIVLGRGDVKIIEGRSYVPVRDLCRLLDLELAWEPEAMQVSIRTNEATD